MLNELSLTQAQTKLKSREITSVELVTACLDRIKKEDGKIKALITVLEKEALEEASIADEKIAKGEWTELLGIPFIAKDNILTKGVKTTASSKILEKYIAPYDATIIKKLKEAGAILLAKSNLDEFAHGASTENSAFGTTHNPWDLTRVPGGSSGGSAAAVASDMCVFALGTDTGGSVRCPASFCGVVGLKPTYGRASRFGLIAMTSSTDVPGPLTKTVEDAAIVQEIISGIDKNDLTTVDEKIDKYSEELSKDIKGLKIGLPKEYFEEGMEGDVAEALNNSIEKLKELGAEFVDISLPHTKYAVPVYYIITPSEISSNLARFDGIRYGLSEQNGNDLFEIYSKSRGRGFGPEAKRRIMLGTYALSAGYYDAYYLKAQKVRTLIKNEMDEALKKVDVILTPTSPHTAFKIGEQSNDPLKMYLEDIYVTSASLAGLPAVSVPCGFSEGLPIGMQLIGARFDEKTILRVAGNFEKNYNITKPEISF
ncbi:MAG: Asp-tRNA(Asn)/Glu-tRNA(Gln) amidotransferase subunit GatA [Patescibacteria group bacterium]|jgi:aspartyl-tRNA(Asn)/glutamyl-tRNA(Gln) amidotransferase subunit A|nr:Asp-tRNA(Asn)/Glu-tRNA(Gln) amidotransferase subunit GatA [Patescibacteria group bacterium]